MNRIQGYLAIGTLLLGTSLYGAAQNGYWPRHDNGFFANQYWEEGRRTAERIGHEDGINDGRNDFMGRRSFRPTQSGNFKHADRGYDRRFGDKGAYKEAYRQAYQRGYEEAFHRGGHYDGPRHF